MIHLRPIAVFALAIATMMACAPAPQVIAPTPSATGTAGPVPAASEPAAQPSSGPSGGALPSAGPSGTPIPSASGEPTVSNGFDLTKGKVLRAYDFEALAGLYYDFSHDQYWAIDAQDDMVSPARYQARRFGANGVFDSAVALNKVGEKAPDAVDGLAFDLSGVPAFTYRRDRAFNVRRIYTATVQDATRLPNSAVERAGVAALASEGNVFSLGVMSLDPDVIYDYDTKDREIVYNRGSEDFGPEAIFRIKDPLNPTSRMAMTPTGHLYLFGAQPGGGLGVKRLDKSQALTDIPMPLPRIPDQVYVAPSGDLLLAENSTGNTPAKIRRFTPAGASVGETEIRLADGRLVFKVSGLTFNGRGKVVIAGTAIASNLVTTTGLFTFD